MIKLIDFWAPWCGNCKAFAPVIDEAVKETGIEILKVDASTNMELCDKYGVTNLPLLVIEKDGNKVEEVHGLVAKDSLIATIKKYL